MAIPSHDRDGNTFSPKLRADQKELDELYAQAPAYAAEGEVELERLFAAGAERRAVHAAAREPRDPRASL